MILFRTFSSALVAVILLGACGKERPHSEVASDATPERGSSSTSVGESSDDSAPRIGSMMPDYRALNLDGTSFDIKDRRGNVVLLNIWATWCGPCRYEIPELEALHQKHAGKRFEVIGVSIDDASSVAGVKAFVRDQRISYPIVLDTDGAIAGMFQTTVIPTSALIDRKGKIVWMHVGVVTAGDRSLARAIESAL